MNRESNKWEKLTAFSTMALAGFALIALVVAYRQILEFHNATQAQHLLEKTILQIQNRPGKFGFVLGRDGR